MMKKVLEAIGKAKFIGKISEVKFLVELNEAPGYGCIVDLMKRMKTHAMKLEAFPKWVVIDKLPKDFQLTDVDLSEFTYAESSNNL